jgi:uncharacterized secreted protein with C-terminal beta-propeller domain
MSEQQQKPAARRRRVVAFCSLTVFFMLVSLAACALVTGCAPSGGEEPPLNPAQRPTPTQSGAVYAPTDYQELYAALEEMQENSRGNYSLLENSGVAGTSDGAAEILSDQSGANAGASAAAPSGSLGTSAEDPNDYSRTNVQVEGIDEGDVVKTDGSHIYVLSQDQLVIFEASGSATVEMSRTDLVASTDPESVSMQVTGYPQELHLSGSLLMAITAHTNMTSSAVLENVQETRLSFYDISDPASPQLVADFAQSGSYKTSRRYGETLYLVSEYYMFDDPVSDDPRTYVPLLGTGEQREPLDIADLRIMPALQQSTYTVVTSYELTSRQRSDQKAILGGAGTVYMSYDNLYLASTTFADEVKEPYQESVYTVEEHVERASTQIIRVALSAGTLDTAAQCMISGQLLNQFSLDEYEGNLRLAVTVAQRSYRILKDESHGVESVQYDENNAPTNALYVLDATLNVTGSIEGLAEDERIYSARFSGPVGYMVTYREMDPLFALDLSDPAAPKVTSALKIPGFSTYLHFFAEDRLLGLGYNTTDAMLGEMKLSMFDTSDAFDVQERYFQSVDTTSSEALREHRAVLVDTERALIGFPGYGDSSGQAQGRYFVYRYDDTHGFILEATLSLNALGYQTRALISGEYLYVCSDLSLDVFELSTFEQVASLKIRDADSAMPIEPLIFE